MELSLLIIAYVFPLILVVWCWLGIQGQTISKILITLMLPVFYGAHWLGLVEIRGWPFEKSLPEQFQLLAADISEPDKQTGTPGFIYLWIRQNERADPRAYKLTYNRKLHQMLHETRQKIASGRNQIGIINPSGHSGPGAPIGRGQTLQFQNAPRPTLPPKN